MLLYVYFWNRIGERISLVIKIGRADNTGLIRYKIKMLVMKDEITLLREENKRLNTIINVLTEKLQETETALYAYAKSNIGIEQSFEGILENKIGINERVYANEKNNIGIDKTFDGIQENKIGINEINIGMLMNKLKLVMNKCTANALNNTAKTLVQFYTNKKCSQKDLMKVTGLSLDGMAKHIKALKTRNLIIKVAFQEYILSDIAIKMVEAAKEESN